MDLVGGTDKISFFEMAACDSLYTYFQGGFKYIYSVITGHYDSLVSVQYYADEAYLIFDLALQSYYLFKRNCLYSENFFSFTRSAISFKKNRIKKFKLKHKIYTLICEVVLPYIRVKIQKWYQEKQRNPVGLPFKKEYLKIIPILNASFEFTNFMYQLKFLVQRDFRFFKPYWHLCNFLIRRKNLFEEKQDEEEMNANLISTVLGKYNVFLMFLFVKYCQWYFSQSNVNQVKQAVGNDICPPPKYGKYAKGCGICHKKDIENPCALETSGCVFCFVCIQEHIEKTERCPVTNIASTAANIRKIYK